MCWYNQCFSVDEGKRHAKTTCLTYWGGYQFNLVSFKKAAQMCPLSVKQVRINET